jgi:hypothetical protein
MRKIIAGMAFMVFLGGCVSKRQHVRELFKAVEHEKVMCQQSRDEASQVAFNQGAMTGRQEMLKVLYETIATAPAYKVFDFLVDVRKAQGKTTENQEFSDWSKEAKKRITPTK